MSRGSTIARRLALTAVVAAAAALAGPASAAGVDWTNKTLPAGVSKATLVIGTLHTRIYQAGPANSREAVVFVHGNPGSADDWPHLVSVAGRYGRAVALDMAGFGEASKPATFPYSPAGEAAFLGQALAALGI